MPEIRRLSGSNDWIDLNFVESERTPDPAMKLVFRCIWRDYHFRLPFLFLMSWCPTLSEGELRQKHDVEDATFLVDGANHLQAALHRAGPRF